MLQADICQRAVHARDARFDGIFFVGITTTKVYCRPVCPARVAYPDHRRFFNSAATAERAGFRPCMRCRPELAPGLAPMFAVSRLARSAAHRIAAGALNGHDAAHLARELGVSERHLRRAMEREMGVSPLELAQTHRLLLAKRLLADTTLSVTRIAFASGFQSLRRFNAVFRERYRMSPGMLRGSTRGAGAPSRDAAAPVGGGTNDLLRLTLAYRPPLAWDVLVALLRHGAIPGVESVQGRQYARTVRLEGRSGIIIAEDASRSQRHASRAAKSQLDVHVSPSLLPVLMPLLARLRQLFDLDAEPLVVDEHLSRGGLEALVRQRPGVRIPGAIDGFEIALTTLLGVASPDRAAARKLAGRVAGVFGDPIETGIASLDRLTPTASRIAEAGVPALAALGIPQPVATSIVALAAAVSERSLRLEPGGDPSATVCRLTELTGMSERSATMIAMRTLSWPDAFPGVTIGLRDAAASPDSASTLTLSQQWRPWRAYAAVHLWLSSSVR